MKNHDNSEYFMKQDLLDRGWTASGIKKFLGTFDDEKVNHNYRSGATIKLYLKERVLKIEGESEFQQWKCKSKKRSESAIKRARKQADELIKMINGVEITITSLSKHIVTNQAIENYVSFQFEKGNYYCDIDINSDKEFLRRITENHIRHNLTEYDYHIHGLIGKVGKDQAYESLRERVDELIGETYPWLIE